MGNIHSMHLRMVANLQRTSHACHLHELTYCVSCCCYALQAFGQAVFNFRARTLSLNMADLRLSPGMSVFAVLQLAGRCMGNIRFMDLRMIAMLGACPRLTRHVVCTFLRAGTCMGNIQFMDLREVANLQRTSRACHSDVLCFLLLLCTYCIRLGCSFHWFARYHSLRQIFDCCLCAGTCMGNILFMDLRMVAMLGAFPRLTRHAVCCV
jgi:hypothetical protein